MKVEHEQMFRAAVAKHQAGLLGEAAVAYRRVLQEDPGHAGAMHFLGVIAAQTGDHADAEAWILKALAVDPRLPNARRHLGNVQVQLGQLAAAEQTFRKSLELQPEDCETFIQLAEVLKLQENFEGAKAWYERVLAIDPNHVAAAFGNAQVSSALDDRDAAIAAFRHVLTLDPLNAEAHNNLGVEHQQIMDLDKAVACYNQALRIRPDYAVAHGNLGGARQLQNRLEQAVASYRNGLRIDPRNSDIHANLGGALLLLKEDDAALRHFLAAWQTNPRNVLALSEVVLLLQEKCDWDQLQPYADRLQELLSESAAPPFVTPFVSLTLPVGAHIQQRVCQQYAKKFRAETEAFKFSRQPRRKLTIGYLSANFNEHAVAYLAAELFEKHNRDEFRILAYSYGVNDRGKMRLRLESAFDEFFDVRAMDHISIANRIHADGVDILVDLMGYTKRARTATLALRPAPIQVNYLGYTGTMGADFIDYIIADRFVIPNDKERFFTEKVVCLPDSYQVNDSQREISSATPSRAACGLPDDAFVFCCFNRSGKITREVFEIWMNLLQKVPESVLWLSAEGDAAGMLSSEARRREVDPTRLVFATRQCRLADHLARMRNADLFLDTWPYNAHTTTSDALWAGVPVLTCPGETFASRVAGSLLQALGMDELIASSPQQYASLALDLAFNRSRLWRLRREIGKNRSTRTLFNGADFARRIEAAYRRMWELWISERPCQSFEVEAEGAIESLPPSFANAAGAAAALLSESIQLHQEGRLELAERGYRKLLGMAPDHEGLGDAWSRAVPNETS